MSKQSDTDSLMQDALSAAVQVLPLPAGLYLFSVKAAKPSAHPAIGQLQLPAMHVGLGPGVRSDQVEFVTGPATDGAWLFAQDDLLVTKVKTDGVTLMLTSVRAPGGEVLSIKVERLESRLDESPKPVATPARAPAVKAPPPAVPEPARAATAARESVGRLQIIAHIRARGDMVFNDETWAGRVSPGLWIESFAVKPVERFETKDFELKGLTGSGFETPWIGDGQMCGTRGMSTPLVGFAVRLKPGPRTAGYDCEYSGYFKSGAIVGPIRNGAPCRSTVASDALEGIQVRVYKREKNEAALSAAAPSASKGKTKALIRNALTGSRKQGATTSRARSSARRT